MQRFEIGTEERHKAMETNPTPAARMRRKFKAGRKMINHRMLTALDALYEAVTESNKARDLMREEGLNPDDVACALIYRTESVVTIQPLPAPGEINRFFKKFEELQNETPVSFLGIIWRQIDREAGDGEEPKWVCWVTQFLADPASVQDMKNVKDKETQRPRYSGN